MMIVPAADWPPTMAAMAMHIVAWGTPSQCSRVLRWSAEAESTVAERLSTKFCDCRTDSRRDFCSLVALDACPPSDRAKRRTGRYRAAEPEFLLPLGSV